MSTLLTLKDVVFRRGDFSFEVDLLDLCEGNLYLLNGSNGAGKSTLLHLLAQLVVPESGKMFFRNQPVCGDADRQRLRQSITLVEQTPFLFDCSVFNNLAFGLRLRDVRGDLQKRRIQLALDKVGLDGFAERRAKALSGGEIRRVALARALVLQPRVLLLDETIAGLDSDSLILFEDILADFIEEGVTVVLASHDPWQPQKLQTETFKLAAGRLVNDKQVNGKMEAHQCQSA